MSIQFLIKGEPYLFDRYLKNFIAKNVDATMRDFNFERLSAKQIKTAAIVDLLNTPPMMANSRIVIVEDCDAFKKEDLEILSAYFKEPNDQSQLILIGSKIDKRTAFYKALTKIGEVQEFKKPYENQVPAFVSQEAKNLGLKLENGVADLLVSVVGADLFGLINELEKLQIFLLPETLVTKKHVDELVARGVLQNVFLITNLIAEKKLSDANKVYQQMEEQGEPLIKTVSILVGHFRKLLLVSESAKNRVNPAEMAGKLGISPYFLKDYLNQIRFFTFERLKVIYAKLMELSEELRSSRLTKGALFEDFLKTVCLGK